MIETLLKALTLLAIFGTVFLLVQLGLDFTFSKTAHTRAINKRLSLLKQGASRDEILSRLRKNAPQDHANLPPFLASILQKLERTMLAAQVGFTPMQMLTAMLMAFVVISVVLMLLIGGAGFTLSLGVIVLALTVAGAASFVLPVMVLSAIATRRRKRVEEQFPIALDVFVRALRAGHPIAAALDLLTQEMEDPIGSEFGLVSDEVAYGAELTDALTAMAERWDLDDIRMFVVSLSVQNETGGNLAEILQNLAEVIRARASLYMKVRALSSEGRMTGWMLTILPVAAFVGLFMVNPEFYLSVAGDRMFIIGFIGLMTMYVTGFFWIRKIIDLKV